MNIKYLKLLIEKINNSKSVKLALSFIGGNSILDTAIYFSLRLLYNKHELLNNPLIKLVNNTDLHFIYPTYSSINNNKKNIKNKWYNFICNNEYKSKNNWLNTICTSYNIYNIQIHVKEIDDIMFYSSLTPIKNYKIFIVWLPELLNIFASNKLLKIFENIPKNNIYILVSNTYTSVLDTLLSRTNKIFLLEETINKISNFLNKKKVQVKDKTLYKYIINMLRISFLSFKKEEYLNKGKNLCFKYSKLHIKDIIYIFKHSISIFHIGFLNKYNILDYNYKILYFINNIDWDKFIKYININNLEFLLLKINKLIIGINYCNNLYPLMLIYYNILVKFYTIL